MTQDANLPNCEQERIHTPGAIQPHGALLAALAMGGIITHASANLAAILGADPQAVLGRTMESVIGAPAWHALTQEAAGGRAVLPHGLGDSAGSLLLHAHRSGARINVDIEPAEPFPGRGSPLSLAQAVIDGFGEASTCLELCQRAVVGLRAITGYDRVIAYRFDAEDHGEVFAEARDDGAEPMLGLRYPASDIPRQARAQYLRQRIGAVADAHYQPVPLLVDARLDDGSPLDLTNSLLRSVSPVHCEYMRNMGTTASMTVALAQGQTLWGMLVCHHTTPRIPHPDLRAAAQMIGQVASLLLGSLASAEIYAGQVTRASTLRSLAACVAAPRPLPDILAAAEDELLRLVGAEGAVLRLAGSELRLGRVPPPGAVTDVLATLRRDGAGVIAVDDLALRHPHLAHCRRDGSGVLLLPLSPDAADVILWFRPEKSLTVSWGGDPGAHAVWRPETGRFSPRASFATWQETVRGRSLQWDEADLRVAAELRAILQTEIARRTRAEMALMRSAAEAARIQQEALERRAVELTRSNEDLQQFAYIAAHDLQEPLRMVASYTQLLSRRYKGKLDSDADDFIGYAVDGAHRMQHLVRDMLSYCRVGTAGTERRAVRCEAALDEALLNLQGAIEATGGVVTHGELPMVFADPAQLSLLFQNLIGNALKYRSAAPPRVHVSAERDRAGDWVIAIADNGIGIEPAYFEKIFVMFQRLHGRADYCGTGIGLSICKKIAERHGGRIWVESVFGRGSTFFVALPEGNPHAIV